MLPKDSHMNSEPKGGIDGKNRKRLGHNGKRSDSFLWPDCSARRCHSTFTTPSPGLDSRNRERSKPDGEAMLKLEKPIMLRLEDPLERVKVLVKPKFLGRFIRGTKIIISTGTERLSIEAYRGKKGEEIRYEKLDK